MTEYAQNGTQFQTSDEEYACASSVAANTCVYLSAAGTVATADSGALATMPAIGIVVSKRTTTTARVRWEGEVDGFTGLTPGAAYYVGSAGALSTTPGLVRQFIGIAQTATQLLVLPGGAAGVAPVDGSYFARCVAPANVTISTALVAGQTIDGVVLAAGDRVLLAAQSTGAQNGLYAIPASGVATYAPEWALGVQTGSVVHVGPEDTAWPNSDWRVTATQAGTGGGITVGTTDPALYPRLVFGVGAIGTVVSGLFVLHAGVVPSMADTTTTTAAISGTLAAGHGTGTLTGHGTGTDAFAYSFCNW